jgi:sugar lactone lactonase YvrE
MVQAEQVTDPVAYHGEGPVWSMRWGGLRWVDIDVFDYDRDEGLTGRRPFAEVPAEDGHPDGLTVDKDGGVWVALYDGGAVRRYTPEGVLDEVIELPTRKVTACTFGGLHLNQLFITTSREGFEPGTDPLAGSLFRAVVGVTGRPIREFAR